MLRWPHSDMDSDATTSTTSCFCLLSWKTRRCFADGSAGSACGPVDDAARSAQSPRRSPLKVRRFSHVPCWRLCRRRLLCLLLPATQRSRTARKAPGAALSRLIYATRSEQRLRRRPRGGCDDHPRTSPPALCRHKRRGLLSSGRAWVSFVAQLAFPGTAFVLLVLALNPILVLTAIVRQLFGDFVESAYCAGLLVSIRAELYDLPNGELVHSDHRFAGRRGLPPSLRPCM